jgi:hypothetical protein
MVRVSFMGDIKGATVARRDLDGLQERISEWGVR